MDGGGKDQEEESVKTDKDATTPDDENKDDADKTTTVPEVGKESQEEGEQQQQEKEEGKEQEEEEEKLAEVYDNPLLVHVSLVWLDSLGFGRINEWKYGNSHNPPFLPVVCPEPIGGAGTGRVGGERVRGARERPPSEGLHGSPDQDRQHPGHEFGPDGRVPRPHTRPDEATP